MHDDERQPTLDYRGARAPRSTGLLAKTLSVVLGGVVLVGGFIVSIAFFTIALAFVLAVGAYFWWKTRDLRRQMREQIQSGVGMHEARRANDTHNGGDVIEGVVISRKETSEQPRR
jgi:hypothetical protein